MMRQIVVLDLVFERILSSFQCLNYLGTYILVVLLKRNYTVVLLGFRPSAYQTLVVMVSKIYVMKQAFRFS